MNLKPRRLLHRLKRTIFRINQKRIDAIIGRIARAQKAFFFVQIGSNDGLSGDPLHDRIIAEGWHGILVEPVPYLFKKLVENYRRRDGLAFENAAIDTTPGFRTFYRVDVETSSGETPWYERAGSFSREHLERHRDHIQKSIRSGRAHAIVEEQVRSESLATLFEKHNVTRVDLLHIDAEGYDYEIIKTIPFERLHPQMIWYENKHFSPEDKRACVALLRKHGYRIIKAKDTFAYL